MDLILIFSGDDFLQHKCKSKECRVKNKLKIKSLRKGTKMSFYEKKPTRILVLGCNCKQVF
jgi:hypothetical protein